MITRPRRVARNRRALDAANSAYGTDVPAVATVVATKLRLTFPVPVVLNAVPDVTLTGGAHVGTAHPSSVSMISPTVIDLDYAANVAVGDTMVIASNLQGVRSASGGFMVAQTKVLA